MKNIGKEQGPAVIFDLDGTLIDTMGLYAEAYPRTVRPYLGRDLTWDEVKALRPRCEIRFLRDLLGPDLVESSLADFHRHYAELHTDHFGGIFAGIPELLGSLRRVGLPLGIVTGKSRGSWEVTIQHAPLGDFDALVFADDVSEPKPDPEGIVLALKELDVDPGLTYYLGDTDSDLEAAVAAGVRPAAALWTWGPERRGHIIERAADLGAPTFEAPADFERHVLSELAAYHGG